METTRSDFMNIATYSPALTLLYVFTLLWILMGVNLKSFSRIDRWLIPLVTLFLCIANHLLRELIGTNVYGKLLFLCMHLPTFFIFLRLMIYARPTPRKPPFRIKIALSSATVIRTRSCFPSSNVTY